VSGCFPEADLFFPGVARWFISEPNPQKIFGTFLKALELKTFHFFYDHLVNSVAIGSINYPFVIFCGHLLYFPHFGILNLYKSGNPGGYKKQVQQGIVKDITSKVKVQMCCASDGKKRALA
jgi:hypothetical protein